MNFATGTFTSSINVFISGAALLAFFLRRFLALFTSFSTFFQSTCTYPLWLAIWLKRYNKNAVGADYVLMIIFLSKRNDHSGNNPQGSPANHVGELLFTCDTWPDLARVQKRMAWAISEDLSALEHAPICACSVWNFLIFNICIPIIKQLPVYSGGSCSFKTWSTFRGQVSKQN